MYTYTSENKTITDATLLISQVQVDKSNTDIKRLFDSLNTNTQNLLADFHIKNFFNEDASQATIMQTLDWLSTVTNGNEDYQEIFIVNAKGICITSSNSEQIGTSYAKHEYIQKALAGSLSYSEPSVGKVTLQLSIALAAPISLNNQHVGALIIKSNFSHIVSYSQRNNTTKQILFTSMLNSEGLFTAHPNKKIMANKQELFPELYQKFSTVATDGGAVTYKLLGQSYIGYAKLDPLTNWITINSGNKKDVFAASKKTGITILAINLFFLSLITFAVVRFANGILQYLFSLIEYAKQISEGKLEFELKATHRKDELGVLHNSLQQLVFSLRIMLLKTQYASEMKDSFLANMSHEIRTPLNAILGMAHLILQEKKIPTRIHDFTTKIQIAGHSLLNLINDILDISKVEAGMINLEAIPFNLRNVVDNALVIQQEIANNKGIELIQDYPDNVPAYFLGDPLRIGQILNNLLSNALKFTTNGSVKVQCCLGSVPNDSTSKSDSDEHPAIPNTLCMFITVEDTGIGIPEKALASLFQPFVQADSSITRQFGGTGLGIAISKHLVNLLHGKFIITSEVGKGTRFTFFVQLPPASKAECDTISAVNINQAPIKNDLQGKTILIAEDNLINQLILTEILQSTGAKLVVVNNGQEAVDFLREHPADLVFMDLQMPVLDGLKATKIIRESLCLSKLPIVAVTANAMEEDKHKGHECGMNGYITKPIDPKLLLNVLHGFFH